MKLRKMVRKISYRLMDDDWQEIEKEALREGITANDWCRIAALEKLKNKDQLLTKSERVIYEELSRVRFLLGHGFRLLAGNHHES